jgi:hypothetical protein
MEGRKWSAWRSNRSDTNEAEAGIELKLCRRTEEHHDAPGVSKFRHLSGLTTPVQYCSVHSKSCDLQQHFKAAVLNIHPFLLTHDPPGYKWGQFIEVRWNLLKTLLTSSNRFTYYKQFVYMLFLLTICLRLYSSYNIDHRNVRVPWLAEGREPRH